MSNTTIYLTREDIEEVLHHAHWIAAKNGAQQQFVSATYPGYSFASLMQALIDSGCLVKARSGGHFSGWQVRARIDGATILV